MIRYADSCYGGIATLRGLLVLGGCRGQVAQQPAQPSPSQPRPVKQAPPTPIAEKKEELGEAVVGSAMGCDCGAGVVSGDAVAESRPRRQNVLARDSPAMSEADKRAFWAYTFQALAGAEAGLKPTTDVRHTEPEVAVQDTVTKRTVRQEGLLQLTYMDAKRYGCDFDWEQDKALAEKVPAKTILTPRNNLLCGVKILENQMLTQRKPLLSRRATG